MNISPNYKYSEFRIFLISLRPLKLILMLLQFVILIAGLLLILFGANYLVDGSSSIAKRFGLSEFVIGLTIVGIGTSTPEMVVSFLSAFQGKADMAIGNVVGSNIFNTLLILGASAAVFPLAISKNALKKDLPLNIGVTILLLILGLNFTLFGIGESNTLSRIDGVILLLIFAWYLWSSFKNDSTDDEEQESIKTYSPIISVALILAGLIALIFGGKLFVNAATEIAKGFGMSEKFIAITIMAAGTSMPELATSVVAAFKKKGQLALGNVIGSNISNILLILGGSALINPLSFAGMNAVDMGVLLGCTIFLLIFAITFKKKQIDRIEGVILLLGMAAYMWYMISNL